MQREKYGLYWEEEISDAEIERWMIQHGGEGEMEGQKFGNGLEYHFKEYWRLLWPDDVQTWWTDLILKNVLANQFTALVGPASSWKTGTVSRIALMDWSCFPECTTVLQSSTTMNELRQRIYAETTKMWHTAKLLHPWFPGFPIDSKCVITCHDIEEELARDLRDSIVGVPCKASSGKFVGMGAYCFSPDQCVDTIHGPVPISTLKVGDFVKSATGHSRITNVFHRTSERLIRINFTDGTHINCTPEHPFLTSLGWVHGIDITPQHYLISPDEVLSILQNPHAQLSSQSKVLQHAVRNGFLYQKMQGMREEVCSERCERDFLHTLLRIEMEADSTEHREEHETWKCWSRFVCDGCESECFNNGKPERKIEKKHIGKENIGSIGAGYFRSQLSISNREVDAFIISQFKMGPCSSNGTFCKIGIPRSLPDGFKLAGIEIGCGIRWFKSLQRITKKEGFSQGQIFERKRVDCVTIYKSPSKTPSARSGSGYTVYSIEVEKHPSYSVNGCLVHNSGRKNRRVWCIADEFQFMELAILDAQDNLVSNGPNLLPGLIQDPSAHDVGKPRIGYKCIFIGNTNPSRPGNPIDVVCEPERGWSSIKEDGKTKVWRCKKLPNHPVQCVCVNLDGKDSPNSSFPVDNPRYPRLAGPNMLKVYTEGSESYWSQGRGVFKFGLAQFKIITAEICEQFNAFQDCVWEGTARTKIGMLDASYGGGDRCPLGWLEFGKCVDGKTRIKFMGYWLVPIIVNPEVSAEYQIAMFTKSKMEENGVPPENFFFDGRGSLAMALAAAWSPRVNAVEFGGPATNRPVGGDIYTIDKETKQRRLKLSNEHFSKFVTELWFSWLYATQADQIRNITRDIVSDAQPREWYKVAGDRIEMETKAETKKRTGLSPDLADMFATGVEGARRRGFIIGTLANPTLTRRDMRWLDDLAAKSQKIRERYSLKM